MNSKSLILLCLFAVTFSKSAFAQSVYVNSANLIRGTLPTQEVRLCTPIRPTTQSAYCPIVASNCPSTHPLCRTTTIPGRSRFARPLKVCACTNTTAANAYFVNTCPTGSSCNPVPIATPTPTPTVTPKPTVTPTPTPTPTSTPNYGTLYLEAQIVGTNSIARNGQVLIVHPGNTIQYRWGSPGAVSSYGTYSIAAGSHTCSFPNFGYWPNGSNNFYNMQAAGGWVGVVDSCQVGATFEIVFRPSGANSAPLPEARVYISVVK